MMRSVPWVAGCCGPMLRVMPSVSSSTLHAGVGGLCRDVGQLLALGDGGHRRCSSPSRLARRSSSSPAGMGSTSTMPGHGFTMRASSGKSLRSGIALEVARQVDVAEVRVPDEVDAEHLPRLALVPVGAGVDRRPRRDPAGRRRQVGLQRDADVRRRRVHAGEDLKPGRSPGDALHDLGRALGRRLGRVVLAAAPRRRLPVEGREEPEVRAAERVAALPRPASTHAAVSTRTQMSSPGLMTESTSASPSSVESEAFIASRRSSTGGASGAVSVSAADDNRLTPPALGHVLVLDALLQQHDPLEQRLGPRRAARHVHVDGDDLVDALRHRVASPSTGRRSWRTSPSR